MVGLSIFTKSSGMAQWIKKPARNLMAWIPSSDTWWEERTDFHKLSFDFHTHKHTHTHTHTHHVILTHTNTHTHTYTCTCIYLHTHAQVQNCNKIFLIPNSGTSRRKCRERTLKYQYIQELSII